jgi:hypothetical protein
MKDVSATLRRIDEEIVGHKQAIARSQVEIMRLQDTRQVLARLVEDDQHAEQVSKMERLGVIAGEHAKPVLIVRQTGTGGEDGSASKAAKNGTTTMHLKATKEGKKSKRDYKVDSAKYGKRSKVSVSGQFRDKIIALLSPAEEMTSQEIGDHLGLIRDDNVRKPMSNALYQLRIKGNLVRDDRNRYKLKAS